MGKRIVDGHTMDEEWQVQLLVRDVVEGALARKN